METGKSLGVRIKGHKCNIRQGYSDRTQLATSLFEEDHQVDWNQTDILQLDVNIIYWKYKDAAHMLCGDNPINQSSADISAMWLPLIKEELKTVWNVRLDADYYWMFDLSVFL